jgi:acetylornithine deacetylase/succinyl-diaminopimelate desuccinylase-like protein
MGSTLRSDATQDATPVNEVAQWPITRECIRWFARERQWINDQHVQLCRIPAPTFLEAKRAEWMIQQFRAIGCDATLDRGGNVVALMDSAAKPPYVALTAHLDTVLAPRNPDDIRVDADGTFRGPGVSDNGAGLAALLAIARALKIAGKPEVTAPLVFVANVGEEGEGNLNGMRFLCRQSPLASKIRAFVVLDGPTLDHVTNKALASRRFEITYSGTGGHSWSDFGVGNPIHALSRAVSMFTDAAPLSPHGTPRASYNFGTIEGGSSINSIATQARAKIDIRSESAIRIDELVEVLTTSVDKSLQIENERATGTRLTARVKEIGSRPGGSLPADSPILRHILAVDQYLGLRSHLDCASTDANIPLSMNLPAISIGAGGQGGGAHTPSEWFHPDGRETGLKRILLTLLLLLSER